MRKNHEFSSMNRKRKANSNAQGYTFAELMIGILMFSAVMMVCFGSYVTLRKGFTFITTFSDSRNVMLRVMDTIETDLRNATSISIGTPSNGLQTLTLKIPDRYQSYYAGSNLFDDPSNTRTYHLALSGSNLRAGEPNAAIISGSYDEVNQAIVGSGTMTVVYSWISQGVDKTGIATTSTPGLQLIRSGTWTDTSSVTHSFMRSIAYFNPDTTNTFLPANGLAISMLQFLVQTSASNGTVSTASTAAAATLSNSSTPGICIQMSGSYYVSGTFHQTGTLQSIVNLRALGYQY